MSSKCWFLLLYSFVFIFNVMTPDGLSQSRTQKRDLSRYDKAGPYTVLPTAENATSVEAEMRDFLWQHWHKRRLGYVVATFYSREGVPTTSSYFVDPDKSGMWRITVRIDSMRFIQEARASNQTLSKKQRLKTDGYVAYFVERVEQTTRQAIPEGEMRAPQSYWLVLKDQNGKALTEI